MATGGVPAFALPDGFSAEGPVAQWHQWFAEAETFGAPEPAAAVVSTIGDDGFPDARFVLVRGVDDRGFVFYTNFESAKSRHLDAVPHASLVAGWLAQQRSIRVRGSVVRVDPAEADAYFAGRPRGSQIGAWASRQSSVLADRAELEAAFAEVSARFDGIAVPRPEFWGGWRLVPEVVECWHGRRDRLHDRVRWTRSGTAWSAELLYP